jgi:soluble lytic murein transglycosylase-like protein
MVAYLISLAAAAVPASVADAARVGDCATVLAALSSPTSDDERLLVGYCQVETSDARAAAATLSGVTSGVYGDYARWVRARAAVASGRPGDAAPLLEGLKLPGESGVAVRLLRDRSLVATGHSLDAREDLRALTNTSVGDEARLWLARGALDRHEPTAAIPVLETVWAESVLGAWSDEAAQLLKANGREVPDVTTDTGRALVERRIAALRKANRHPEALTLLESLHAVAAPRAPSEHLRFAKALFSAKQYARAVTEYAAALGTNSRAEGSAADLFDYALATARAGDHASAANIYERVWTLHPTTPEADFASFKIGYMAYDRGEFATARRELAAHLTRRPSSSRVAESLWFSARSAWRLGDRATAVSELDRLISRAPASDLVPAATYWKARAKGLAGDTAGERAGYDEVLKRWPTSGYAWFAAFRTGRAFPRRDLAQRPAWPPKLASNKSIQRAESLIAIGMDGWAAPELHVALDQLDGTRESSLAAAHALIATGDYQAAQRLARPYCVPANQGGDPVAQQACFPRPAASIVAQVAGRYDLDPLLPYGIMNAESNLDPSVTSLAGARGLMQLMPDLAKTLHQSQFGPSRFDPDNLYRPTYNAALGTAELGVRRQSLTEVLSGTSTPAVIASYNGGEEAVRRWATSWPTKPEFDEFSEDVGYTETRQYVRRVLGFEMGYRWVYGDPSSPVELAPPK